MVKRDDRGYGNHDIFPMINKGQINLSVTYPGVVRAFHRHQNQYDYWYMVSGNIEVCLYYEDSSERQLFYLGPHETLRIAPNIWHGFRVLGNEPATLLYHVTTEYNPVTPDEERAEWNAFYDWKTKNR